jgi:hypothetical protein
LGWSEIVINQIGSVKVFDSTSFGSGITDELKAYPQETLTRHSSKETLGFLFQQARFPRPQSLCKTATDTRASPFSATGLPN